MIDRLEWLSDEHAARVTLNGPADPDALAGVDPARAGRDLLPYLPNVGDVVNRATTNWCVAAAPDARLGEARLPRARPEARRTTGSGTRSPTSAGSTRTTRQAAWRERGAHAHERRRPPDRAPLRRDPAPRPRHRPDGRPLPVVGLARGRLRDGRRAPPLPEPPERGDVHDARPAARRRPRHGDAPARGLRRADGRDPRRVRGRPGRADRRRPRRRRAALARGQGRRRVHASASSRSSTARAASARSARSSTRRCSTRTPRATSRSATPTSSASSRRGRQGARQHERDPRRLHDRLARARRRRHHARRRGRARAPRRRLADLTPRSRGEEWVPGAADAEPPPAPGSRSPPPGVLQASPSQAGHQAAGFGFCRILPRRQLHTGGSGSYWM